MNQSFIDSNILVYAYDADAGAKHIKAKQLLKECWEAETGVISTQVLQEFYVTVTRKLPQPLSKQLARDVIQTYRAWNVYCPSIEDITAASELEQQHQFSFWDALIIIAAQMSGATTLVTEDLQDGRQVNGVTIVHPF